MKFFFYIAFPFFLLFICNSCKNSPLSDSRIKKNIEIKKVGSLRSRKSYAIIQSLHLTEKEIEKEIESVKKNNPKLDYAFIKKNDSIIIQYFTKFGLAKNGKFLLSEFKPLHDPTTVFIDSVGNLFNVSFFRDTLSDYTYFSFINSKDTVMVNTESILFQNLDYAFLDIIPGGNKELVLLDNYYISNGDNYDLKVYEIVTSKIKLK